MEFTEWAADDQLSHSKFVGLRDDEEGWGSCAGRLITVVGSRVTFDGLMRKRVKFSQQREFEIIDTAQP